MSLDNYIYSRLRNLHTKDETVSPTTQKKKGDFRVVDRCLPTNGKVIGSEGPRGDSWDPGGDNRGFGHYSRRRGA